MTIDVTKKYQTRDGRRVYNLRWDDKNDGWYPIQGLIEEFNGESRPEAWSKDGYCVKYSTSTHPNDLVEVKPEIKDAKVQQESADEVVVKAPYGSSVRVEDNGHGIIFTITLGVKN